jgi:MFS family permease
VAIAALATTVVHALPAFMTASLAVQIGRELDLDVAVLGGLFGLFFGVSALASPVLGRWVQGGGWSLGLRIAATGSGLTMLGMALLARNVWTIAGLFVLGGLSSAVSQPSSNLALARSVPPGRFGLLFGFKHTAVPTATLLAGLVVPTFGLTVGWRWAFVATSGLAFATALSIPGDGAPAPSRRQDRARPVTPVRILVLLALVAALGIGAMDSLAAFLVAYAVEAGVAEGAAGLLLAAGSVAGLSTRLAAGFLIDRRQEAGPRFIVFLMAAGAAGLAIVAAGGRPLLIAGTLLAFAAGWGWSGLLTFVVVRANREAAAAATGITHTGTYVGAAVGPPLVGLLAEGVSFAAAWWTAAGVLAAAAMLAAVAARALREPAVRSPE